MEYGIESGSARVLNKRGKEHDTSVLENMIRDTYNTGIIVNTNWIIGFPNETSKDFLETLRFIWKNRRYLNGKFNVNTCRVLPGTILHKKYKDYGIKNNKNVYTWETKHLSVKTRVLRTLIFLGFVKLINRKTCYTILKSTYNKVRV